MTPLCADHGAMYQFFKDFAGPFATGIAAAAALWVTVYFGRHQKTIAEQQAHTAGEKLRHDLYAGAIVYSTLHGGC
jgi:hypothetical protein